MQEEEEPDFDVISERLVLHCLMEGSKDNITAIVIGLKGIEGSRRQEEKSEIKTPVISFPDVPGQDLTAFV